ncbi:homeobox domain-containing protein [Endozoicomonas sp. 2B-B]
MPLWVKPTEDKAPGNADIVNQGAHWCNNNIDEVVVADLFIKQQSQPSPALTLDLWGTKEPSASKDKRPETYSSVSAVSSGVRENQASLLEQEIMQEGIQKILESSVEVSPNSQDEVVAEIVRTELKEQHLESLYDYFLKHLYPLYSNPIASDEISQYLGLHKSQVKEWLIRAVEGGVLVRKTRPVRYQWNKPV